MITREEKENIFFKKIGIICVTIGLTLFVCDSMKKAADEAILKYQKQRIISSQITNMQIDIAKYQRKLEEERATSFNQVNKLNKDIVESEAGKRAIVALTEKQKEINQLENDKINKLLKEHNNK